MQILNNNVELTEKSLYVTGEYQENSVDDVYIFLEHIIFGYFSDIFKSEVEGKSLTRDGYIGVFLDIFDINGINNIFILDDNDDVIYFVDLECEEELMKLVNKIADVTYNKYK